MHVASGLLFVLFAVLMWRRRLDEEPEEGETASAAAAAPRFWQAAAGAFMVIFVAEWGDLTQLATATLVAKSGAWLTVGIAATLALWLVTAVGVMIGGNLRRLVAPRTLHRVAASAMAGVGIYLLASS